VIVLIVEDDTDTLAALSELVKDLGHTPISFTCASEALAAYETNRPDLVLTDYQLGNGMTGLDLVTKILKRNVKALVIVLTAGASIDLAVNCMKTGAFDFLPKPLDICKLERLIEQAKTKIDKKTPNENCNLLEQERELVARIIKETGSYSEAAEKLGIDVVTLWRKRKQLGIARKAS
jgi:DNA-binding NtrC family response regulator